MNSGAKRLCVEEGADQQDCGSPDDLCLENLVGINGKILAKQGHRDVPSDFPQIVAAAQKILGFGENGDGGGSGGLVIPGDIDIGEIRGDQAFGRGCLLYLADEGHSRLL